MRTVRRLYFYTVAFVSFEVVLWGLVGLARSFFCGRSNTVCEAATTLAQGLALILVGVPVFGVHWWLAQRSARQEMDEHASGVRSVFLYGALLGTLIPILQNALSLLDRLILQAVGLSGTLAVLGPNQSWSDNLIAIVMNAIIAAYFLSILRKDWGVITPKDAFSTSRRIYRFVWLIYSLGIVVFGLQQLLRYILDIFPGTLSFQYRINGAHGLAFVLIGVPIWVASWSTAQIGLKDKAERESLLRLGVLYFLSLAGVVTVLSAGGFILDLLLRLALGEQMSLAALTGKVAAPLSIGIPLALVWAYYGRWLGRAMAESPDAPRRAGMRRLYAYILSAIGLGAAVTGLYLLLSFVVDAAIGHIVWADVLRPRLASALATLFVSLPLWWLAWRPMQSEALAAGDLGDHARRSIIRKVYLYLALFVGVVGGMITAVSILNMLLRSALGSQADNLLQNVLKDLEMFFLFAGLGIYHGLVLRKDGRMASEALAERHAAFPVLIIDPGDGLFAESVLAAIRRHAPHLPADVQPASGMAITPVAAPRAVILSGAQAVDPPNELRRWLEGFGGSRVVVPQARQAWFWAGGTRSLPAAAGQAALAVRSLAEGQEVRQQAGVSGWLIAVYIAAGIFGLELLGLLIGLGISLISG